MKYRDDHQAALERAAQLEEELKRARADIVDSRDRVAELEKLLAAAPVRDDFEANLAKRRSASANALKLGRVSDRHLGPPPRSIPIVFVITELLDWRWKYLMLAGLVFVASQELRAPPRIAFICGTALLVLCVVMRLASAWRKLSVLRWGMPVEVYKTESCAPWWDDWGGTTTYRGIYWPRALGWRVESVQTFGKYWKTVFYRTDSGFTGSVKIVGHEWISEAEGGIILAHSKIPQRAYGVVAYPYRLRRDAGQWLSSLRISNVVSILFTCALTTAWVMSLLRLR